MCLEQLNRPEVSASALQLGIEKCVCVGGGGCTRTTAKQAEAREYHKIITWCEIMRRK